MRGDMNGLLGKAIEDVVAGRGEATIESKGELAGVAVQTVVGDRTLA